MKGNLEKQKKLKDEFEIDIIRTFHKGNELITQYDYSKHCSRPNCK